jgi:hypothetical protein
MPNVLFGHAFGREALLKSRAHAPAINSIEFRNGLYCGGFALNHEAGDAILDHLRDGERIHRSAVWNTSGVSELVFSFRRTSPTRNWAALGDAGWTS